MTDLRAQPAIIELQADEELSVRFTWTNDRYDHRVMASGSLIAQSVEGTPDQDYPPSPPLQQLSLESLDGRDVILGVGAAGRGHWSVSVEGITTEDGSKGLKFDWACRTNDDSASLGTTYASVDARMKSKVHGSTTDNRNSDSLAFNPSPESGSPTKQWTYTLLIDGGP